MAKKLTILFFFWLASGAVARAQSCTTATCTAADCTYSNVLAALPSGGNSNATVVVNIPACPSGVTWTSGQAINYVTNATQTSLSIIAAGGTTGSDSLGNPTGYNDQTVIIDHSGSSSSGIIHIQFGASGMFFRITGLTLKEDGNTVSSNGAIQLIGAASTPTNSLRFDHNHFLQAGSSGEVWSVVAGCVNGVWDHNVEDLTYEGVDNGTRVSNGQSCYGDSSYNGNGTWNNATGFGSANFLFFENNRFNGSVSNDCNDAGRQVFRYNTYLQSSTQTHEMEGDGRGCRATEVYKNSFTGLVGDTITSFTATGFRMGTGLVWGNTVSNMENLMISGIDRLNGHPFDPTPNGWGYCSQVPWAGTVNTSGTAVTATAGSFNNPISGLNLGNGNLITINSVIYTVSTYSSGSSITLTTSAGSQTGVAFYVNSAWDGNSSSNGYPCVDQAGRGQGDLLSGYFPTKTDSTTSGPYTGSWIHDYLEPIYEWLDQFQIGAWQTTVMGVDSFSTSQIQQNRDWYQYTLTWNGSSFTGTAFNGTAGTGSGLLSARPATCTAGPGGTYGTSPTGSYGVAYWGTDTNTLYVCTAANTWTAVYTPYIYPHPLDNSNPPSPVSTAPAPTMFVANGTSH